MLEQILGIWGAFQASIGGCPEPAGICPCACACLCLQCYSRSSNLYWQPPVLHLPMGSYMILCAVAIPTYLLIHFYRTELSVGVGAVPISAATDNPFLGAPGPQNRPDTLSAPVSSTTSSPRTRNRGTTPSTASTRLVCSSSSREHGADGMGGLGCPARGFSAP